MSMRYEDRSRNSGGRRRSRSRSHSNHRYSHDSSRRRRSRSRSRSRDRSIERRDRKQNRRHASPSRSHDRNTSDKYKSSGHGTYKSEVCNEVTKENNKTQNINNNKNDNSYNNNVKSNKTVDFYDSDVKYNDSNNNSNNNKDEFDEQTLMEIDSFLDSESEDEKLRKLELERKKRREEILKRHNNNSISIDVNVPHSNNINQVHNNEGNVHATVIGISNVKVDDDMADAAITNIKERVDTLEDDEREVGRLAAERLAIAQESANQEAGAYDIFSHSPLRGSTDVTVSIAEAINRQQMPGMGKRAQRVALLDGENPHLQSDWDDGEGYYRTRVGEIIADRYKTLGEVGKGVFSTVLKCIDLLEQSKSHEDIDGGGSTQHRVVLKMIRNNDIMRKAADKEIMLLRLISDNDLDGKKHCIKMITHFDYRNHIAIVFESLHMNLRETLKKFGKNVGINISAVRLYSRQLFAALRHLGTLNIVHADIKPDNIVVSEDLKQVKLCDFGSAFRETDSDNDPTPYLVSRFYRAPEIILGLQYDRMVDLWSLAVCMYELFTGHVMFPGRTNNEMLKLMMEVKGRLPNKLIRSHFRAYESLELEPLFDADMRFRYYEQDPVSGPTE